MNKKISPTLIGAFVVGALALVVLAVIAFGSGRLFRQTKQFVLYFENSVNGLNIGAPVKFKGVEIGSVKNILLELEKDMAVQRIPVIIEIDLEKLTAKGASGMVARDSNAFRHAIEQGLRGQLRMESLLTGVLYIGLDIFPGTPAKFFQAEGGKYQEIPVVPTVMEQAQDTATKILAKLKEIDFKALIDSVTQTVKGVDKLVNAPEIKSILQSLNQTVPKMDAAIASITRLANTADGKVTTLTADFEQTSAAARQALEQTQATLKQTEAAITNIQTVTDPDSPTLYELRKTLREVSSAARSLRLMTNFLERNPRALIFGKPETQEGQ
jgi:paraquat-inducible protein B